MEVANFKVYKSSAGSGKTFTLVKEFLRICLNSPDFYHFTKILAITFTNKATYEMKSRILTYLQELGQGEGGDMRSILLEETKLSSNQLTEKCKHILRGILHNYADFNISTIDRFTHKLIRTFTKDLGLSSSFQVELDEETLLQLVVDELLDQLGKDQDLTELILQFTFFRIDEEKGWKVDRELLLFAQIILKEKAIPYLTKMRQIQSKDFKALIEIYSKECSLLENRLKSISTKAHELIRQQGILSVSFPGRSKIDRYFEKLMQGEIASIVPSNELVKNISENKWYASKCTENQKQAIDLISSQLEELFNQIQVLAATDLALYLGMKEVLKSIHSLALLNYLEHAFTALKQSERVLNISDFNRIISKVVMEEPMPFIYERLGEKYQHIMVDEFQDTSVLQFMNLLPLMEDSLAKGNENLLVGDAKQAIYRFRGGEVAQFSEMPNYQLDDLQENDLYEERMQTLRSQYKKEVLNQNYRSWSKVIQFNNAFFKYMTEQDGISTQLKQIYNEHAQDSLDSKEGGYVEINFIKEKKSDEKNQAYAETTYQHIQASLADGYQLSDIAILFRKSKQAEQMATYLKDKGIEVVSSEALKLNKHVQVNLLISLAKWMLYPEVQVHQKEVIRSIYQMGSFEESLDELFTKYIAQKQGIKQFLFDNGYEIRPKDCLLKPPFELFEYLIQQLKLTEGYSLYVQTLQEDVVDFSKKEGGTLAQFIVWWDENQEKLAIDIPDNLNAIKLLTIHKSKGLEFPIVIYPYAADRIEHSFAFKRDLLWTETPAKPEVTVPYALVEFNKKLGESNFSSLYQAEYEKRQIDLINLTYVAFTRAAKRLYILSEMPSSRATTADNLASLLLSFVKNANYEGDEANYHFGETTKIGTTTTELPFPTEDELKLNYLSAPWRDKLVISRTKKEQTSAIKYGLLMHEILSKIEHEVYLDKVLNQYHQDGHFNSIEYEEVKNKLKGLLSREDIQPFFDAAYKNRREATLFTSKGELLRPDRIIYLEDQLVVLDFKTGEPKSSDRIQMKSYMQAVGEVHQQPVRAYILYLETEELVEVSED